MRIVMLSHGYPPTVSGVTLIVQKYSRMLVEKGHTVRVITGSDRRDPYRLEDQGVDLIRLKSYRNPVWNEGWMPYITSLKLLNLIQEFQPDLVHTHENALLSIQLLKSKGRLDIPLVASAYTLPKFVTIYLPFGRILERILWIYLINALNKYDQVIFSNPTLQKIFLEEGLTTPSSIISNGVDVTRYRPGGSSVEEIEHRYNLPPHPRILHAGRLARDKELEVLIKAMPDIHAQCSAHLLLVGRGDHRANLERMIQEMELDHCVHLLGYVPETDLPGIYRSVDLFSVVGNYETQSLPTLQALSSGLPVVLVDAACLPELVVHGKNGYLVPPRDPSSVTKAVNQILRDTHKARLFGKASYQMSKPHAESESLKAFITLYNQIMISIKA
ncbi:MAG: glycosyltransferase [Chloroflexota bacterium]|nr:glycosyltransferase [Chloroflexota bacterium]